MNFLPCRNWRCAQRIAKYIAFAYHFSCDSCLILAVHDFDFGLSNVAVVFLSATSHMHVHLLIRQDKTNVPKEYFVIGILSAIFIAFVSGVVTHILCNVIGFVFPALKSIKAMETHASSEVTQWLVYWVVYAFFSVIEIFVDTLVYWIPFYYRFKLGFLLWAMLVSWII